MLTKTPKIMQHLNAGKLFFAFLIGVLMIASYACSSPNDKTDNEIRQNETIADDPENEDAFYILNIAATKSEEEAKLMAKNLKTSGYQSDYLWIPDYASLSGAKYYSVFIGPFETQNDCEVATENYRKIQPDAYGLLVSQESVRVQINGINQIVITNQQNDISVGKINSIPRDFAGAGCSYSNSNTNELVFVENVMGKAIININGIIEQLNWSQDQGIYTNEHYEINKETQTTTSGHESIKEVGHLNILDGNGNSYKISITGGCGA